MNNMKIYIPIGDAEITGGIKLQEFELTNQQFVDTFLTKYASFSIPYYDDTSSVHFMLRLFSDEKFSNEEYTINTLNIEDRSSVFYIDNQNGFSNISENGVPAKYQGETIFVNLQKYYCFTNYISWRFKYGNTWGEEFKSVFPTTNINNCIKSNSGGSGGGGNAEGSASPVTIRNCIDNKIIVYSNHIPIMLKTNTGDFYTIKGSDLYFNNNNDEFEIDISNALALNNLSGFVPNWIVYFGGKINPDTDYKNSSCRIIRSCSNNKISLQSEYIPIMLRTHNNKFYAIKGNDLLDKGTGEFEINISNALALNNLSRFEPNWTVYFGGKID